MRNTIRKEVMLAGLLGLTVKALNSDTLLPVPEGTPGRIIAMNGSEVFNDSSTNENATWQPWVVYIDEDGSTISPLWYWGEPEPIKPLPGESVSGEFFQLDMYTYKGQEVRLSSPSRGTAETDDDSLIEVYDLEGNVLAKTTAPAGWRHLGMLNPERPEILVERFEETSDGQGHYKVTYGWLNFETGALTEATFNGPSYLYNLSVIDGDHIGGVMASGRQDPLTQRELAETVVFNMATHEIESRVVIDPYVIAAQLLENRGKTLPEGDLWSTGLEYVLSPNETLISLHHDSDGNKTTYLIINPQLQIVSMIDRNDLFTLMMDDIGHEHIIAGFDEPGLKDNEMKWGIYRQSDMKLIGTFKGKIADHKILGETVLPDRSFWSPLTGLFTFLTFAPYALFRRRK